MYDGVGCALERQLCLKAAAARAMARRLLERQLLCNDDPAQLACRICREIQPLDQLIYPCRCSRVRPCAGPDPVPLAGVHFSCLRMSRRAQSRGTVVDCRSWELIAVQ